MRRPIALMLLLASLPLVLSCTRRGGGGGGDDDDGPGGGAIVSGLEISRITINQGVSIPLMESWDEVSGREAPVVEGRGGIVRVYVERQDGWEDRDVLGVLEFEDDAAETITAELFVDGDSDENQLGTTLNFELDAEDFSGDLAFSVSLREAEAGAGGDGDSSRARWPDEGFHDLDARSAGGSLRIVIIPVQYNADGSGRLPDTSESQVEVIRDWFLRMYPASEVELIIDDPLPWSQSVSPLGQGWDTLLNAIIDLRQTRGAGFNEYYYGLFNGAQSFSQWCGGGCIAGYSVRVESPNQDYFRASIGVGYTGEDTALTMAHEVGHAHGREHAPCGLLGQPSDPGYPNNDGTTGVTGYDVVDGDLTGSNNHFDIMSYCDPSWVSDYTYDGFFDRIRAVNAQALVLPGEATDQTWSRISVGFDGHVFRGADQQLRLPPEGKAWPVALLDAKGDVVDRVDGAFSPYSHLGGGVMWLPELGDDVVGVDLGDGVVHPLD